MSLLILSFFLLSACTEKQVPDGVSKQDIDQVTQPSTLRVMNLGINLNIVVPRLLLT